MTSSSIVSKSTRAPATLLSPLEAKFFHTNAPSGQLHTIVFVPFGPKSGRTLPWTVKAILKEHFNKELAAGLTYPQYGPLSSDEFEALFLSYDVVLGLRSPCPTHHSVPLTNTESAVLDFLGVPVFEDVSWSSQLACFYYIKPNYPGRSSHLCNAGFVVPDRYRGQGFGGLAGSSFLHFGPALGYQGSVFNLVYDTNVASLAIWRRLGFSTIGKIPKAGLINVKDSNSGIVEAQYVDAWIIYKDFDSEVKPM